MTPQLPRYDSESSYRGMEYVPCICVGECAGRTGVASALGRSGLHDAFVSQHAVSWRKGS